MVYGITSLGLRLLDFYRKGNFGRAMVSGLHSHEKENNLTASYTFGTVTVAQGSTTVTGDGTGWDTANISPGYFGIDTAGSIPVPVLEVVSDTELTLVSPWRGADASGVAYWLSYDTRDGQQTVNNAQRLAEYIARLDSAALAAINGLEPEDQTLILFTGSTSATLLPIGQVGGLFDVQVPDLAARAAYDSRLQGFRVLVSDTGGGIAAIYTKLTDTTGDWSTPAFLTGPTGATGDPGPFTEFVSGTTTTLPAGSQATFSLRDISEGVKAIDVGLPRGLDGTGIGDMLKSIYDPQGFERDVFADLATKFGSIKIVRFSSSGTYTPSPGMIFCVVECQGAGGAGGGAAGTAGTIRAGGGGSGGTYSRGAYSRSQVGVSQAVTVGAGGVGSPGLMGSAGSASSFGSLCSSPGGSGGNATTSNGGSAASASPPEGVGDFSSRGGFGAGGLSAVITSVLLSSGAGGGSFFGSGAGGVITGTGSPGVSPGSGGSGGSAVAEAINQSGGNGAPGAVVVTEFIGA